MDEANLDSHIYFYTFILPMIWTLSTIGELSFLHHGFLYPVLSLVWSALAVSAWCIILGLWSTCEGPGSASVFGCPNFVHSLEGNGTTTASPAGLWSARLAFAGIAIILFSIYLWISAAAVHANRVADKRGSLPMKPKERLGDDGD